ncbi:type III secretion system outer membrane ring subunit SctC [Sphingomonas sp. RB3P16]|uniref:type III secretion system outer membrane ring subunit SctC n=1 Tax=Parasphingomonas frigoris TaxID=3096163 RepID=UPI002FC8B06B
MKFEKAPVFAALVAALATTGGGAAVAQRLPAAQSDVSIAAREQPIGAFIRDLFGRIGRPVVTSPKLTGTINGTFTGQIDKVFGDVAKAFGLIGYYDGTAIYVYATSELTQTTLNLTPAVAARVVRQAGQQRLPDARNVLRPSADGSLVVSGVPRFIEQITALAAGGEARAANGVPPSPGNPTISGEGVVPLEFRVYYLKYARAEDTTVSAGGREVRVPGLATIVQNLVLDRRQTSANGGYGSRPIRQSQPRLKGQGLDAVAPNYAQTPVLGLPSESGTVDDGGGAPLSQDIVRIEANPYLNALIVRDVPERIASYDSLISALDVEPQLIEIEATIIDINTDKMRQLGINWRFAAGGFGALLGDGTSGDLALSPTNQSLRDNLNAITPRAAGGTISTIIGSQREFLGRITALEQKGAARVVSRPQVMTLSNVEAVFDRTRTFYVRVAGREEVDLFNVTAGTTLRVNPHVFRDHNQTRIRVLVNIEDGSISPTSVVENIPIVERASVSTQAMVLDGESLLLGGMTVDADTDRVTKVPLVGDIPLLGELFKTRYRDRGRTERMFLITPRVVTLSQRVGPTAVSTSAVPAQAILSGSGTVADPSVLKSLANEGRPK